MRRVLRTITFAIGLLIVTAGPASADAAKPTNDRSRVDHLDPATPAVRVDIIGGDSFVRLRVEPGHEAVVLGYEGEPYLVVHRDGVVEQNRHSPAAYLNVARYGPHDPVPASADAKAPPEMVMIGAGGEVIWHDHRTHNMGGPISPTWEVGLLVDGAPVVVRGTLVREGAPQAWPWLVAALASAGVVVAASRRRVVVALGSVAVASALAGFAAFSEWQHLPRAAGGTPAVLALPLAALIVAAVAVVVRRTSAYGPLLVGAGVALLLWVWRRAGALDHAVTLSGLPPLLERAAIAFALGAGLGAVIVGLLSVIGPLDQSAWSCSSSPSPSTSTSAMRRSTSSSSPPTSQRASSPVSSSGYTSDASIV